MLSVLFVNAPCARTFMHIYLPRRRQLSTEKADIARAKNQIEYQINCLKNKKRAIDAGTRIQLMAPLSKPEHAQYVTLSDTPEPVCAVKPRIKIPSVSSIIIEDCDDDADYESDE
eukprot:TRINITY_DN29_c0_g1_i2.p1 TRINITY_DN29_c0_g1~~TRINITY_DN29_c0_g1_i2.p1  ORF type:complete len:115 (-),score=14.63 TRINITY_DN29_c0_g1_i2:69-413(-)